MLKGIPPILSPELFKTLMEMGHGSEIVIADGNFPTTEFHNQKVIRCDGLSICPIVEAILKFFPLDYAIEKPITLMAVTDGVNYGPVIWKEYEKIIKPYDNRPFEYLPRFDFYERTKKVMQL